MGKIKNWAHRKYCPICRGKLKRINNSNPYSTLLGSDCGLCGAVMWDNGVSFAPLHKIFYYSYNNKTKMYTLYTDKRKPVGKYGYKSHMDIQWRQMGGKCYGLLIRIMQKTKKKVKR